MRIKCLALASWIGLLVSTVSEYCFDVDFPLTPPLWLVIAISALLFAGAHSVIGRRIHCLGARETGICVSDKVSLLSDSASFIKSGRRSPRASDRPPSPARHSSNTARGYCGQMTVGGVILAASDAIPAVFFLRPAATRGPPCSDDQINRMLGRPARPFSTAPLSSETHLHDSSVVRNVFLNGTDQTPIRSTIGGDQT
jgi:hypothetical protein